MHQQSPGDGEPGPRQTGALLAARSIMRPGQWNDGTYHGDVILEVTDLVKYFPITGGFFSRTVGNVKALDGVSFFVRQGETLGIVGESGCGKSTMARVILRLLEPTSGRAFFEGQDVFALKKVAVRNLRRQMQIIFQDPYASLNPRMTVGELVGEPLKVHGILNRADCRVRVMELLEVVGLSADHYSKYPHEFSGGQRQRVGIARALALNPKLIICDEPVSALDVSIQSQVLNLLKDLQQEFHLAYLFISHNLAVVKHISDRVGVMYLGKMVEMTDTNTLFANPRHPYTKSLLSAIPHMDPTLKSDRIVLTGDVPSPVNVPPGCRFHTRCRYQFNRCRMEDPVFADIGSAHFVACHLMGQS
ncbi:MAG: dipeptide ABC transporter ATP-binding protein [Desulfatirhabdiaceae bacterium]